MLSCYIIDDEEHPVELLSGYIAQTPDLSFAGYANDPVAGLQEVMRHPPDLLFLDVDMPVLSGFQLYDLVGDKCTIVFTTAFPKYAVEAYNVDALDFLLKPIRYERFLKAVHKVAAVKKKIADNSDYLFVQSGVKGKILKISYQDIVYIESFHNYLTVHLQHEDHIVYLSLKDVLEKLPPELFCRIHRSYIINFSRIKFVEGNRLYLEGSPELAIGDQYKEVFFQKIQKDLLKKK